MPNQRDAIRSRVDEDHGVTAVSMGWLREHYEPEWGRLSVGRAAEISAWLKKSEIMYLPSPLPPRETAEVMLYRPQSPVGAYISAARLEGVFEGHPEAAADFLGSLADRLVDGSALTGPT
ncbi:hypothetical protein ACWY4P_18065 [Streptomyces sp. LZ34]